MKRFRITIEIDAVLDVSQLWPDGDAPENPTAADVRRLVDDCGGVKIIRDWDLDDDAFITVDEVRHPHQALVIASAMTSEKLHHKSEIAAQLAWRD